MSRFRTTIRAHVWLTLTMLALVLAVRSIVPAGFMVGSTSNLLLTVTVCADATGTVKHMQIAIPHKGGATKGQSEAAAKNTHCAFSGLGDGALRGADTILLAAALAFILLVGLAPLPILRVRDVPFLRPQLRGPPALSV